MSDFYIGYLPNAPRSLGVKLFRIVAVLAALSIAVVVILVLGQQPFADSKFEYLQFRDYEGTVVEHPYPWLVNTEGWFLLVAPGKHGATELVRGLNGRGVRLKGSLIQRGADRMLELEPGSLGATGSTRPIGSPVDSGPVTLRGEIVDSKCYFGVMNPGSGKVHRACAARCISGGIPPAFIAKDAAGVLRSLVISGPGGRPINAEILDFVAEPLEITGRLRRYGDILLLESDPSSFHRITSHRE